MTPTGTGNWPHDEVDAEDNLDLPVPGSVRRGHLRFSHPALAEWSWPYTIVRGREDGPRLALISGVHPAEYPAIEANIQVTRSLDPTQLRGTVISLPLIDVPAFLPRTPFVCPIDNKNPNRFFPGNPDGTFTDIMNHAIFGSVVAPADFLLDLHGGDMVEALVPFAVYSVSGNDNVDSVSAALGRAFGLPFLIANTPTGGGPTGMTVQAASARGIPALIAEAGGCGLLTEPETQLLVNGARRALRHLCMLDGPPLDPTPQTEISTFSWLISPAEGMWYPAVTVRDLVAAGQTVGRIGNLFGDTLVEIAAPHAGTVLFLTTSPAMRQDGLLLAIGA